MSYCLRSPCSQLLKYRNLSSSEIRISVIRPETNKIQLLDWTYGVSQLIRLYRDGEEKAQWSEHSSPAIFFRVRFQLVNQSINLLSVYLHNVLEAKKGRKVRPVCLFFPISQCLTNSIFLNLFGARMRPL